jgi:hypothetical protein
VTGNFGVRRLDGAFSFRAKAGRSRKPKRRQAAALQRTPRGGGITLLAGVRGGSNRSAAEMAYRQRSRSTGGRSVFDAEVGHEGVAADFAAELLEPAGGGVVRVVEEVVAGGVAADGNSVPLADADLGLVALPAGVEFAAEGIGLGALDLHALGAGAAGLTWSEDAVGVWGEGAAGKRTGAESDAGAQGGEPAALLAAVEVPFTEAVFGEGGVAGGQGDATVLAVFGDPDGDGVGDGGGCAHGPGAAGEEEQKGRANAHQLRMLRSDGRRVNAPYQ